MPLFIHSGPLNQKENKHETDTEVSPHFQKCPKNKTQIKHGTNTVVLNYFSHKYLSMSAQPSLTNMNKPVDV